MGVVEFKVKRIQTFLIRERPDIVQKTPEEEIPEGPFRKPQNFSEAKGKIGNLQVVLEKPMVQQNQPISARQSTKPRRGIP